MNPGLCSVLSLNIAMQVVRWPFLLTWCSISDAAGASRFHCASAARLRAAAAAAKLVPDSSCSCCSLYHTGVEKLH